MNLRRLTTLAAILTTSSAVLLLITIITACSPTTPVTVTHTTPSATTPTTPTTTTTTKHLDDAASLACDDFALGWRSALTTPDRLDLTRTVNKWAQRSTTPGIATGGKALARTYASNDSTWNLASDGFATACLNAGWKAE